VDKSESGQRGAVDCVLMFSGGRDSSIAAVRLARAGRAPALVTISSDHLLGIGNVKRRLAELAVHLPAPTRWLRIKQPLHLATDTSF
jgi:predicted subunit of tRNA(5-methylaminomethyl-2-thiouridylate) methyltransferase